MPIIFCSCSASNENASSNIVNDVANEENYSYKSQMDIAMKHAANPEILAAVNGIKITQVDVDLYSIGSNEHSLDEIIKYNVISLYADDNNMQMPAWYKELYDSIEKEMFEDEELTEEYRLTTYGITKSEVIDYAKKRTYQIGMYATFSDNLIDEVSSGDIVAKYPELKKAYKKFEKDKLSKGSKAWEDIENAYYEMIAKNYDVVIY